MARLHQPGTALSQKLLGSRNPEDPKRCELHAYILEKLNRWEAPKSVRNWEARARRVRKSLLEDFTSRAFRKL